MIPFGRPRAVPGTGDNKKILSPLFIPRHEESHSEGVGIMERFARSPPREHSPVFFLEKFAVGGIEENAHDLSSRE
jgi:hypothetical protein